ncbi:MAG: hypothetical protein L0210_06605 [Rhodospirillales bacterium]|nr:hypothetical protein [Rhodospirillales bacterium]
MVNPFEKRATEYLRDDEAFLAVVTPEPLVTFFRKPAREGRLYDRLATIIGTPGSGKTTLARLFQYPTLRTLLRNRGLTTYKPLVDALGECRAIADERPAVVGCRLPLEAEYREFWEFPYPEELKTSLMIALLQARAVLAWLRNLQVGGHPLDAIALVPRADAEAATTAIGGTEATAVLERARQMELSIYRVSAALVAPDIGALDADAVAAYRPLDVIEAFRIGDSENVVALRPLVIFDDAHNLHPTQLVALQRWLARRELKVARWILMRLDALTPSDVLTDAVATSISNGEPGLKRAREITEIWLQSGDERGNQRRAFRKMAKDMANRYLGQMEIFSRRRLQSFGDLLATEPELIAAGQRERLVRTVNAAQRRNGISAERRGGLEVEVDRYLKGATTEEDSEEVRLAMLNILMERYANRVPQGSLFEGQEGPEPSRPLTADSGVADGAKIHLLHRFDRPYYFGIDMLCDASSENAEQFLQLASRLVSRSETQLIRAKSPSLRSGVQHQLLRERATEMVQQWDFPQYQLVRRLADWMAAECLEKTLEPNASLGSGATAVGIPQDEFDLIPAKHPDLAKVLQFGVAYNAFTLVPQHGTKKRIWCLIQLGGVLLLHHGLSLRRGGFLERRLDDIVKMLSEP